MKTVIEMARNSGFLISGVQEMVFAPSSFHFTEELKRFAELVRADEREKYKWDVHSCGPTCTKVACVAVREAVEAEREQIIAKNAPEIERMNAYIKTLEDAVVAEREACAKVCDELIAPDVYSDTDVSMWDVTCIDCASAIRARSKT